MFYTYTAYLKLNVKLQSYKANSNVQRVIRSILA